MIPDDFYLVLSAVISVTAGLVRRASFVKEHLEYFCVHAHCSHTRHCRLKVLGLYFGPDLCFRREAGHTDRDSRA